MSLPTVILSVRLRIFYLFMLLTAGLSFVPSQSYAQGVSSEGKEFWLGFMPNYIDPADRIALFIASGTKNRVKVEVFGGDNQVVWSRVLQFTPDQAQRVNLSVALAETKEYETPVYRAIRVTSTAPCVVYGYSDNALTTDGYLGLPLSGLGKEYIAISYYDDAYSPGYDNLGGEFLIVAPYDGTSVTIKTTATTTANMDGTIVNHQAGDEWTVSLSRGQVYLVRTTGRNYGVEDLTGSSIIATKPIGFLTGHQRASIQMADPDGHNSKDHLIEMIPSIDRWGTEYYMMPQKARTKCGDYIRCISAEDNNIVSVNGSLKQINKGEYFEVELQTVPTVFRSENGKRFLAMDYSYMEGVNGDQGQGDPDMTTLIPKEQFQNRIIFRTPTNDPTGGGAAFKHYATIVCHKDGINLVTLKKGKNPPQALTAFGAGAVTYFGGTDYAAQRVQLTGDEESYVAEGPMPMGIYLYGFANVEGYGYPAGMALKSPIIDPIYPLEAERLEDCGDFDVRLTETHLMPKDTFDDSRISDVYLVTEPDDVNWNKPSTNYLFELDPKFEVGVDVTTFTLRVFDKTKDAYAAVYTVDQAGNDTVYEYQYSAPKLGVAPKPEYVFAPVMVDQDSCIIVTLKNEQPDGDIVLTKASIEGRAAAGAFTVNPTDLNITLKPGETTTLQLCFHALDTMIYRDSLIVQTECAPFKFALKGEGVIPKIYATDRNYGMLEPGMGPRCLPVTLENRGKYTLIVNAQDLQPTDPAFTIDPAETWPKIFAPKEKKDVSFCFSPKDTGDYSVTVTYATNIPDRFKTLDKNYSVLTGISRKPGAKLSVLNQGFGPTNCLDRPFYTDTLYNDGDVDMLVDSVTLVGPGKNSYNIVISIPAGRVTSSFVLAPGPKDNPKINGTQYVVQFDPNYAGITTAPQQADLVAWTSKGPVPITHVTGSRIAPVLALDAGAPIDFGNIKTNTTKDLTFDVKNTGTAPLKVTGITSAGPNVGKYTLTPTAFTLPAGASQTVTVTFAPGQDVGLFPETYTVVTEKPNCTEDLQVNVQGRSNQNSYTAEGADYETVFTCKNRELSDATFGNLSSDKDISIMDIQIVNAKGWDDVSDFQLKPGLSFPILVGRNGSFIDVPAVFTPTSAGLKQAGLKFTFELENATFDTIVELRGIGDVVPQVVAVGAFDGQQKYTATMNDELHIPIKLKETFKNRNANVRGYSFDVSFKRDAFKIADDVAGPANVLVEHAFKSYDPVTDMETYTVRTKSQSPTDITIDEVAAELHLLPRVHRGIESDITVANAAWTDASGNVICYIPTEYVPAKYQFDPLCGDLALQSYLNDKSIKDIAFGFITPNPVSNGAQVNFEVNVESVITLSVSDALGNEVVKLIDSKLMKTGKYATPFDATTLAEGTYYCRLSNGTSTITERLVITK